MNSKLDFDPKRFEILIVDDEPENIRVMRTFLEEEGYDISAAPSGKFALEIASRKLPDLILLDVRMPEMDGFEACRLLKLPEARTRKIPVIFVTALRDTKDIVRGFQLDAVDYITKPYRREEVCARVNTHLQMQALLNAEREQAERFRVITNNIADALVIVDSKGIIRFINPAGKRLLGYPASEDELIEKSIETILEKPHDEEYLKYIKGELQPLESGVIRHGPRKVLGARKDGIPFEMDISILPMFLDDPLFVALLRDRSLPKKSEADRFRLHANELWVSELEHRLRLYQLDSLTNIANRRRFEEVFAHEWKRAVRSRLLCALILIDVDYFKLYNDTYGHQAGDHCLQKVASVLDQSLKRQTDLAGRYGGEEFIAVLPGNDLIGAMEVAEAIRSSVEALEIEHSKSEVADHVTVSIGVAVAAPDVQSKSEELIGAADNALYEAKNTGRNQVKPAED